MATSEIKGGGSVVVVFMLVVLGLLLIIVGIQLRRGKWYGIVAGNTFKDKPIEVQKKVH
ncbi:hypothetical protein K6J32_001282 [Enterococcus faecium]|nr:hypothetical protein [Enterococcus faecium]